MKIQHLAIIFIMIILPISMVISYYVNAQIQTINAQELYDAKLVTATYDSVKSFQLNTLNSKYSNVSDSKMRDIEAGISSFFNSLGTELGATGYSRVDLQTYIPAIVYSLYDGYYIYGKYYDESYPIYEYDDDGKIKVDSDGSPIIIDYGDYRIGLKPYVYYSCRYRTGKGEINDFVVNYTLDNTITIYGKVNGKDVAYSGGLINIKDPSKTNYTDASFEYYSKYGYHNEKDLKTLTYAQSAIYKGVEIEPEILSEKLLIADENGQLSERPKEYEYTIYHDQKIYVEKDPESYNVAKNGETYMYKDVDGEDKTFEGIKCFLNYKNQKQYIPVTDVETMAYMNVMTKIGDDGLTHLYNNSACQYVSDACKFSKWVNDNLSGISQENAVDQEGKPIKDFDSNTKDLSIFKLDGTEDPTDSDSTFNANRDSVIKRTLKSNLIAEMANFSENTGYECRMPYFSEEDWDKITNNMCVSVFMQGMPIGMKYYNNYCIVPNDKNKEVVTEDSIYIITNDTDNEVHYAGCQELINGTKKPIAAYRNIDFERQTVVSFNSIIGTDHTDYHFYPHDNRKSYECMVNAKGIYDTEDIIKDRYYYFEGEEKKYDNTKHIPEELRKIYVKALLREKYNLYKTNGYFGVPIE